MALIQREYPPREQTLQLIRDSLTGWYNQTRAAYDNAVMLVWRNPFGLTPQEVFDTIGKDGAALVEYLQTVVKSLNDIGIEREPIAQPVPTDKEAKSNPDGSITVSDKAAPKEG